jgi:SAM-dependent methyltransferase
MAGDMATERLKLHLGCGTRTPAGWLNVDAALGARLAKLRPLRPLLRATGAFRLEWSDAIRIHDLRRPFPWPDDTAEAIYSSHTLEPLSKRDGARFLDECARVLAPGGVLRIAVPDLALLIADYEKGALAAVDLIDRLDASWTHPDDGWLKRLLAPYVRFPHRCMYDAPALLAELRERGLSAGCAPPLVSRIRDVAEVECPERVRDSVIAEAVKPHG